MLMAIAIIVPLASPLQACGQAQTSDQNAVRRYGRGKIIAKDQTRYEGRSLMFGPQSLTFVDSRTGQSVTLPRAEVEYVSRIGSHAKVGALGGGLLGLLAGLAAWAEVEADPTLETKDNVGPVIAGVTLAGAGIGALVGFALKKETTVFQRNQFVGNLSLLQAIPISGGPPRVTLISYSIRF
jgi:hypothetical protein